MLCHGNVIRSCQWHSCAFSNSFSALLFCFIVIVYEALHELHSNFFEICILQWLNENICPNFLCWTMINLNFVLCHFILDKGVSYPDVFGPYWAWGMVILHQLHGTHAVLKYIVLLILIPLCFNEIPTPLEPWASYHLFWFSSVC